MCKVLHFSPVRKESEIVRQHLDSLKKLKQDGIDLTFSFFDDNQDIESSVYLREFVEGTDDAFLHQFNLEESRNYYGEKRWVPHLYQRISIIKNKAIDYFLKNNFDYLFLTDSDLIIHPYTLEKLIAQKKDFCSSIFWTHFDNSVTYTPNAWYAKPKGFDKQDLLNFKTKGVFAVDYTGACTLLSRNILEKNVSFAKISNIEYLGEDKHFCIRAAVMGFQPYVSTFTPAFHIYTDDNLKLGENLLRTNFKINYLEDWLNKDWVEKVEAWLKPKKKSFFKRIIVKYLR